MKLADYMRINKLTDAEMAGVIGDCSEGAVRKWKSGERVPRARFIDRIHAVTNGQVAAGDFFASPEFPAAVAERAAS